MFCNTHSSFKYFSKALLAVSYEGTSEFDGDNQSGSNTTGYGSSLSKDFYAAFMILGVSDCPFSRFEMDLHFARR